MKVVELFFFQDRKKHGPAVWTLSVFVMSVKLLFFCTFCGRIFCSVFCVCLLLVFLRQNVCIWKCLQSTVPVLTLELQGLILWLLIGRSESYVLSVAYLRQLQESSDSGCADLFCLQ